MHRRLQAMMPEQLDVREVMVGRLDEAQSISVANALLGAARRCARDRDRARGARDPVLPRGAREPRAVERRRGAAGRRHPAHARSRGARPRGAAAADERRLLGIVAVAGRPVAQGIAARAAAVDGDIRAIWTKLRPATWCARRERARPITWRAFTIDPRERLREPAGPRPRRSSPPARRGVRGRGGADPEVLSQHWLGAGVRDAAGATRRSPPTRPRTRSRSHAPPSCIAARRSACPMIARSGSSAPMRWSTRASAPTLRRST